MAPALRMPKSPIKTSAARHDEHCKEKDHRAALDPDCPICQLPVGKTSPEGVKEGYSVTPCGHVFGSVCVKTYLAITDKPQCPICRTDLFYRCSHPVHPAFYNHKRARLSPSETAAKAFPGEFSAQDCKYCRTRKMAMIKRRRRREMMNAVRSTSASSSSSSSSGSAASGTTAEGSESGVGAKATRWALHTASYTMHMTEVLAKLTLDVAGLRILKTLSHRDPDSELSSASSSSSSGSERDDDDDNEEEQLADTPVSPSRLATSSSGMPPVPGLYGHWDLATKEKDWKFLSWYNSQEPKINPSPEHYAQ